MSSSTLVFLPSGGFAPRCASPRVGRGALFLAMAFLFLVPFEIQAQPALEASINAGYNYVVDSNVLSPSTYAPSVATVMGRLCNTGTVPLTDVSGYIGDMTAGTPGLYPTRDSSAAAFITEHPHLATTGLYSLTHVGGSAGLADATRYVGSLDVGECRTQYWHMTYPRRTNPDNTGPDPVWGLTRDPDDDLWLTFDIWVTSTEGASASATHRATLRNEISANANKIEPNGGIWFNDPSMVKPGELLITNGFNYDLGVINKGFDNDGDLDFDFNAWLQPIGDPSYDPSCYRLVKTEGQLVISRSGGNPDTIIDFVDQLYFTDLPDDNNGGLGVVKYTFLALNGPCATTITPYQEVASGADNEKFAGDFGTEAPSLESLPADVTLDKSVDKSSANLGETLTYSMDIENTGASAVGQPDFGTPLVVRDSIPSGTSYVAASASFVLGFSPNDGVRTLFSTDGGTIWSSTEPANPALVTDLQWWLRDPLPAATTGTFSFQVTIDAGFGGLSIPNTAGLSFANAGPFAEDSALTLILGTNTIGDFIWRDLDQDGVQDGGAETAISDVTVSLYFDADGDGLIGPGDLLIGTTTTAVDGSYSFPDLVDGDFVVQVDKADPDLGVGWALTTDETIAVTLAGGDFLTADFGFSPILALTKTLTSASPATEGELVTYDIQLTNLLEEGGAGGECVYTEWANDENGSGFNNPTNALGAPDGQYADTTSTNIPFLGGAFNFVPADLSEEIVKVEVLAWAYVDFSSPPLGDLSITLQQWYNQMPGTVFEIFTSFTTPSSNDYIGSANAGLLVLDATSARTWSQSDLNTPSVTLGHSSIIRFSYSGGGGETATFFVDALGVRVTTQCSGPLGGVIQPLPLADTYNADLLEFVSAVPPVSSVTTGGATPYTNTGALSWADVGPLPGLTSSSVTVTFRALEPPDTDADGENDPAFLPNDALATGAFLVDGTPVNEASDDADTTVNPRGTFSGTVWNDSGFGGGTSGDGIRDGAEQGIPSVTVTLFTDPNGDGDPSDGVAINSQVTDANGDYLFLGLTDGSYVAVVDTATLPGSTFTQTADPDASLDNQGGGGLDNDDSNPANDDIADIDFGYTIPNTVFGNLWEDNDANGSQGTGENPFAGVTVNLLDCGADTVCGNGDDGATVSATTDANGDYSFEDVVDGNYRVAVDTTTLPAGVTWSQTVDPDATLDDRTTATLSITGGNVYGPFDFAYTGTGSSDIGDTLFTDWDGDGVPDIGEEGIASVTVFLYEDTNGDGMIDPLDDALVATTVTSASGGYLFPDLPAGDWIVVVDGTDPDLPDSYVQSLDPDEAGICATCDGSASVTTDGTADQLDVDFAYQPSGFGQIGDTVFLDADRDGIQDAAEAGIASITVTLYEDSNNDGLIGAGDAVVATVETNSDGGYLFRDLPAGNYLVDVDAADADLPTDGNGDQYILSTANDPQQVTLATANDVFLDADFGFTPGGVIGDTIWRDDNGDGLESAEELPIANVTVSLYDDVNGDGDYDPGTDTLVATDVTDVNGQYQFSGLPAGAYVVVVDSTDPDLPSTTVTYDADGSLDFETGVDLSPGQIVNFVDFGIQPPGVIGDVVFIDNDGDGIFDPTAGDEGISGTTVELYNDVNGNGVYDPGTDTLVSSVVTDTNGLYAFGDLSDGDYVVVVNTATLPANLNPTFDPDEGNGCVTCDSVGATTLTGGNIDLTLDFGYQHLPLPELRIDKDTTTPIVVAGGQATYTIKIQNAGTATAEDVGAADTLPAGFTYATTDSIVEDGAVRTVTTSPSVGANAPAWGVWDIAAKGSLLITFTVDVGVAVADGTYDNTATASYDSDGDNIPDTTVDDDGTQPQDADTPPLFDPEDDEDVTVQPAPVLAVTKVSSAGAAADPGETITYAMTVTNNGSAAASNVTLSDALPEGTTYVASSSMVTTPVNQPPETFADDFESGGYAGSTGTQNWATSPWSEIGDDGSATGGDVQVVADLGDNSLEMRRAGNGALRQADLSAFDFATLTFDFRRSGFDNASDLVTVEVSNNGGGSWTPLATYDGATIATDATYQPASFDISNQIASNTQIRFVTAGLGTQDRFYVDDVQIEVIARPTVLSAGAAPAGLVVSADGYDLLPGETMTVTFQAVVDSPAPLGQTSVDNTVFAAADEIADPVSAEVSDPLNSLNQATIGDLVWNDVNGDGDPTGEDGLAGVRVLLYTAGLDMMFGTPDDVLIATEVTDTTGAYDFIGLSVGTYQVVIDQDSLPPSYFLTTGNEPLTVTLTSNSEDFNDADFGYQHQPVTLPVTLSSFRLEVLGGTLRFTWTTETETANVGFFLYGETEAGWVPLHDELIPSLVVDSVVQQQYTLDVPAAGTQRFLLIDIDTRGRSTHHGPFTLGEAIAAASPRPAERIQWSAIRMRHHAQERERQGGWRQRDLPEVEISVPANGLYRITWEQLDAAGLDLSGVPLHHLAVTVAGEPVAAYTSGKGTWKAGAALELIGERLETLYADTNLYRLSVDPATAERVSVDPRPAPRGGTAVTTYRETARVGEENLYSFGAPNGDPWIDRWLLAFGAPASAEIPVSVDHVVDGGQNAVLRVELWGVTAWPERPDHHVVLSFNGRQLASVWFDGLVNYPIEIPLPEGLLREGENLVRIELPNDTGLPFDLVALDRVEVTFDRQTVATQGTLSFEASGSAVEVSGLPSEKVTVYRESDGELERLAKVTVTAGTEGFTARFRGSDGRLARYIVTAAGSEQEGGLAAARPLVDIHAGSAEYLILSHPDFLEALPPLVAARQRQGLTVRVVDVEDVYAHYSGGVLDAEAIRSFIAHAATKLGTRYVLLVGGDSYDYKNYLGIGSISFLPSLYSRTGSVVYFAPSDPLYGDLDYDRVPDLAIGRFPVRTVEELEEVIAKTLTFEQIYYRRTTLVATDADNSAEAISFREAGDQLTSELSAGWEVRRADIDHLGVDGARSALIQAIEQGTALTQYFGHSGPTLWSFHRLFDTTDASALTNDGYPTTILQWGCWNTYYVAPENNTMAHRLLLSGAQGAAAVLGAATLTTSQSDLALGRHFLPLVTQPGLTVGEALTAAKQALDAEAPGAFMDVIVGWTLLGDPALVIDP